MRAEITRTVQLAPGYEHLTVAGECFSFRAAVLLFATSMMAQGGSSSSSVLRRAEALLQEDRPQQAIDLLLAHPREIDALQMRLTLGSAYTLLPDVLRARKEFDEAIQLAPRRSDVHRQYGRALMMMADLPDARSELEKAEALDPSDVDCLYDLAVLEASEDEPIAASATLERAIALSHDPARLRTFYTTAGQIYLLAHNWNSARHSFSRALSLDTNSEPALVGLATALEQLTLVKDAAAALTRAVALDAKDAQAWEQLGRIDTSLGDCRAAVFAYSQADRLRPNDRSLLSHLARALNTCGQKADAAMVTEHLKAIVEDEVALGHKGPELARINSEAISFEQKGDYPAAEQDYRQLVGADPDNPVFHRNLGLVLCREARWSEGLAQLKKALSLDPDDTESKRALLAAESASKAQR